MKPSSRILVCLLAVVALSAPRVSAQWIFMKSDGDTLLQQGIQYIYNVQFDKAIAKFKEVKSLYPDHPAGYFLDAMVEWWRLNINRRTREYDAAFLQKIETVLNVCDKQLENDPKNITGLFFKGGALGFRARFHAVRESMINAANDGKEAFDILMECKKIAPGNHDIMLGTGIYNYFAVALPEKYPLLKPVMVFFPGGDKFLGILQLQAAARKARYAYVEAEVVLFQVYYDFEKDPRKAMEYASELFRRYPDNPYFHKAYGRCAVQLGPIDSMEVVWRDVLNRFFDKRFGYDNLTAREALYYIGLARMRKNDYEMALKYLYKCDEACRSLDEDPSGFMIKTNLLIGQIYDLQGKRDLAVKQYDKVLAWSDNNGSHAEAQRYRQQPYR